MILLRKGLLNSIRRSQSAVLFNTTRHEMHTLPDLPYDYGALEPIISGHIMELHHSKHHAAYVNNLNVAEQRLKEAQVKEDVKAIISIGQALKFNGGGHINHSIFWHNLAPRSDCGRPEGDLEKAINRDFGALQNLKYYLSALATGIQGSGWAWLGYNKQTKTLQLATCANQDPLEPTTGLVPLFGIDVWEHAYYMQYKNMRVEYAKEIWEVANWQDISERFIKASS